MRQKLISVPICLCLVFASQSACNLSRLWKARRVDAISGILDAFRTHQIVALGEGIHGNNQSHAVRLALLRDPASQPSSTTSSSSSVARGTRR